MKCPHCGGDLKQAADSGKPTAVDEQQVTGGLTSVAGSLPQTNKRNQNSNTKWIVIAVVSALVVVAAVVAAVIVLKKPSDTKLENGQTVTSAQADTLDESEVRNIIERYCNAICENDFSTLTSIYAPSVERYHDAYNKDRDWVVDSHRRYDETFGVYEKKSSIRWSTFSMNNLGNGRVSATVVEDFSIDRYDKSKYSIFVLEKHFVIDASHHIVSVYDNQLSKEKAAEEVQDEPLRSYNWQYEADIQKWLQGNWEWSGYIDGMRMSCRLGVSDDYAVLVTPDGVLDQGHMSIDLEDNTIHFGSTYINFDYQRGKLGDFKNGMYYKRM